jgi:RNA polymerase primary sigma factor
MSGRNIKTMSPSNDHLDSTVSGIDPEQIWYVPDRRLRTKSASHDAVNITSWILTGQGMETPPDEQALFIALHTCAFRAARPARGRIIPPIERKTWGRRWQLIREYIVEHNLGLVYSMIGRFNNRHTDDDDVLSEAMFALARAVDRFNPWRGFRFSTYACNVIARSLMRRGKQSSRYRRLFPVQHDVEFERPGRLPDTRTELFVERLNRVLDDNLGDLTDIESRILTKRFLNDDESNLTFREIGNTVGLSKERVRQIQNIALNKLREVLRDDPVLK